MMVLTLFLTFFKIGLFTIGGGYAMIPMILQDVQTHGWLTQNELVDFIAISESTPGPFAINIATFVGAEQAGLFGSVAATLGVIMPSFLIILFIARWFTHFQDNPYVQGVLSGLRPAVVGLIGAAALKLLSSGVFYGFDMAGLFSRFSELTVNWKNLVIFALLMGLSLVWKKLHPIFLMLASGLLGVVLALL